MTSSDESQFRLDPMASTLLPWRHSDRLMRRSLQTLRKGILVVWISLSSVGMASALQATVDDDVSQLETSTHTPSKFRSDEDGWFDISGFIDQAYGFVPVAIPITEPAVGYGGAGALAFMDRPDKDEQTGFGRPNITTIGGLATDNGTWGVVAADSRYWMDDRVQTSVTGICASVNLDFYGIGKEKALKSHPLSYNLEPLGGLVQAKRRLGDSPVWVGLGYLMASTQVDFDEPAAIPGLPDFQETSHVGGLTPSLTYDSRNTIFTPTGGTYVEAATGLFSEALGGDGEFQRVNLTGMHFLPLHPDLILGVRGDGILSFGDVPFYLRPSVSLRGAQAMRYQGEHVTQVEAELRWQFWRRFSIVGFIGAGMAWNDFDRFDNQHAILTGGAGARYELARKYGLHVGLDVAFGPDDPILYIQFGSAWMRP